MATAYVFNMFCTVVAKTIQPHSCLRRVGLEPGYLESQSKCSTIELWLYSLHMFFFWLSTLQKFVNYPMLLENRIDGTASICLQQTIALYYSSKNAKLLNSLDSCGNWTYELLVPMKVLYHWATDVFLAGVSFFGYLGYKSLAVDQFCLKKPLSSLEWVGFKPRNIESAG